jgi:hypothetical protein
MKRHIITTTEIQDIMQERFNQGSSRLVGYNNVSRINSMEIQVLVDIRIIMKMEESD